MEYGRYYPHILLSPEAVNVPDLVHHVRKSHGQLMCSLPGSLLISVLKEVRKCFRKVGAICAFVAPITDEVVS